MTLYEKVQKYLRSEGWRIFPQYTKAGKLMKNSPLVMSKIYKSRKTSFVVVITKRNIIHPAIYVSKNDNIKRVALESMHINEFLLRGISNVFNIALRKKEIH